MVYTFCNERNALAMDTLLQKPTKGIPTGLFHLMQQSYIERLAGAGEGDYLKNPEEVYIRMLRNVGVNKVDQYLADNPLSMGDEGFQNTVRGATTGAEEIILDGILIDAPEAVAEHMEQYEFPRIKASLSAFDEEKRIKEILQSEYEQSEKYGGGILKTGHGFIHLPGLYYTVYGYANYFMAFALYPDIIEKHFKLQADLALLNNKAAARAYIEGGLPPMFRADHDMADSRGTLANIKTLEKIWFPEFARCMEPVFKSGVRVVWHCDGNLMQMVPRLIDVGIKGFQGFQYEDGMDYVKICKMKAKDGTPLIIEGGVSVTRTLPFGTPEDVRREMQFLVENGPETGLFLSTSSSVTPGVPWENIEMMIEGFRYYRQHGRD
jgi:hypothetical protein